MMFKLHRPNIGSITPALNNCYIWEINNFTDYYNSVVGSPAFHRLNISWEITLNSTNDVDTSPGRNCIIIGIRMLKNNLTYVIESFRISILNDINEKVIQRVVNNASFSNNNFTVIPLYECQPINLDVIKDSANNILILNVLRILIECGDSRSTFPERIEKPHVRHVALNEFENLFDCDKFSDISIFVDGKEIRAHKNILSTRSPVFHAMFEHDMKENMQNKVEIKDITYEVLKEVIRFMYTGKIEIDIETIAIDLLKVADKYVIEGLKILCEESLIKSLTVDNAFQYLNLAFTYNIKNLKSYAISYIIFEAKYFIDKPSEFALLQNLSPEIMYDFFRTAFQNY